MRLISGAFELSGVCVTKDLVESEFLSAAPLAKPSISNGVHRSYDLPATTLEGRDFRPRVYFTDGTVTMIDFFPCDSPITSWDNWSEEGVLADKKRNDEWLRGVTGTSPVYTASWGTLGSYHDTKGGFSLISVRFKA